MRWEYNEAEELRNNNISEASLLMEFDPDWPLQAISNEWVLAVGYSLFQRGKEIPAIHTQMVPPFREEEELGDSCHTKSFRGVFFLKLTIQELLEKIVLNCQ